MTELVWEISKYIIKYWPVVEGMCMQGLLWPPVENFKAPWSAVCLIVSKRECPAVIYTAFFPPHSHTQYNPNVCFDIWQQLKKSKMSTDPGRPLFILSAWAREGEKEAVEEFILGQYGNSIEINHKPTMILLSSWSCIYNSEISQSKNSFFWSSFDKDLTWTE